MNLYLAPLLSLILAHVLGDFVLQRNAVVEGKRAADRWAYLEHGGVHLACLFGCLLAFSPETLDRGSDYVVLALLAAVHLGIDAAKSTNAPDDAMTEGPWRFVIDQILHLCTLGVTAHLLVGPALDDELLHGWWVSHRWAALVLILGYTTIVIAAGYLNAVILDPIAARLESEESAAGVAASNVEPTPDSGDDQSLSLIHI